MSQLPGSPAYLWATGAEGNGLDAMYASINEFLSTNPTAAQIAAAKAEFGVSDADIAAAQSRVDNQVVSSPPPIGIAADYDSYWKNAPIGSYTDFAGGVIYRYSENEANFISGSNRKDYTIRADSNLNEIANIIPEVGAVWKEEYGFAPTPLPTTPDYYSPVQFAYAAADRDPFATRREVALDPEIRAVDLSNVKNGNQAWEKLAVELYGGKNMTIEDIARIEGATGAVGRYSQAADGTYFLPPEAVQEIAQLNRVGQSSPLRVAPGTLDATVVTTSGAVNAQGFATASFAEIANNETLTANLLDQFGLTGIGGTTPSGTTGSFRTVNGQEFLDLPNGQSIDITGYFGTTIAGGSTTLTNAAGQVTGVLNNATGEIEAVAGAAADIAGGLAVPQVPADLAGIATGFAAGFTAGLPELPTIEGALRLTAAQVAGLAQQAEDAAQALVAGIRSLPERIPDDLTGFVSGQVDSLVQASGLGAVADLLTRQNATIQKAKAQATLEARNNEAAGPDWRVRLSLAPGAQYLYKDPEAGILAPLFDTNGVIFPYTPTIETSYVANYDKSDLVHSNYRGYFYKNSAVNDINIRGTFTAQDTNEADYMLAVIHFFRSVTRMFYGQDALRGAPPPLVYLSGFGQYQFNDHPCLVSNFSYSLPDSVDYIRAGAPNNYGNLFSQRARTGAISANPISAVIQRLSNSNLPTSPVGPPAPSPISQNVNNITEATYVPTKIEINITLLPTNTRSQVSQQFSVKEFANGNLLKGGFW